MTDLAPDTREAPAAPAPPPPRRCPAAHDPRRGRSSKCCSAPAIRRSWSSRRPLAAAGVPGVTADGALNAPFVIAVSLGDAALVVALITWFMWRNGESMAAAFVAGRRPWREAALGVGLAPLVLLGISLLVVGDPRRAPSCTTCRPTRWAR